MGQNILFQKKESEEKWESGQKLTIGNISRKKNKFMEITSANFFHESEM